MKEVFFETYKKYVDYILGKIDYNEILSYAINNISKFPASINLFFFYACLVFKENETAYERLKIHGTPQMLEYTFFLTYDNTKKVKFLEDNFKSGNRSPLLYAHTYSLYEEGIDIDKKLKLSLLRWANIHDINLKSPYDSALNEDLTLFREIYNKNKNDQILKKLCIAQLEKGDYSDDAFIHYKKLASKQIYTKELNEALINSAYENRRDDIGVFPIKKYLENININEIEDEEKILFIIHLIIIRDETLIKKYNLKQKIIEILTLPLRSPYSILSYAVLNLEKELNPNILKDIRKRLYDALFSYEVTLSDKSISSILVSAYEKKEAQKFTINKGSFKVTEVEGFSVVGFNEGGVIIPSSFTVRPYVRNKKSLYKYFYESGFSDTNNLINLSKIIEKNSEAYKDILISLLGKSISEKFRGEINGELGFLTKNITYYKNHLEAVVKDYTVINEKYSEEMFTLCIKNKEYELAKIITNIQESVTVKGFEIMIEDNVRIDTEIIYNFVLKGYKSDVFINYLLATHKIGIEEWLALEDERLNEKIIEQAYKQRSLLAQKIFPSYYYSTLKSRPLDEYTNFLCEQAVLNDILLDEEVVKVLEHMHMKNKDKSLLIAIGICHLKRNNYSKILEKCILYVQEEGIYLKQFSNLSPTHLIQSKEDDFVVFPDLKIRLRLKHSIYNIYTSTMPIFYGETINYFFEKNPKNIMQISDNDMNVWQEEHEFFYINNAYIYLKMLRFDELEKELEKFTEKKIKYFVSL